MLNSNRSRYLLKNTVIFAIGNFSTKLIAFFLVPFYTYVLTTEEYGVVNLIFTLATLIGPLLMLNLQDAVRRFALENNADHKAILTVEWIIVIVGYIIGLILIPLAKLYTPISLYAVVFLRYIIKCKYHFSRISKRNRENENIFILQCFIVVCYCST